MSVLRGFPRATGRAGARNHVFVLPSVVCSTLLAREIAESTGATSVSHQHGCGHIGDDIIQTRRLFTGLATNPNVARTMVVSLGCETVQGKLLAAELNRLGRPTRLIGIQDSGGYDAALDAGTREAQALTKVVEHAERAEFGVAEMTIGIAQSRLDERVRGLVTHAVRAGARVVIAADDAPPGRFPDEPKIVEIGDEATAPVSVVRNAGSGARLLAAMAACHAQVLVDFPAPDQPPQGFPLAPVVSVAAADGLHGIIADDFDLGAGADAAAIWSRVIEVYSGADSRAELRGSASFAIPRLLRTM